MTAGAFTVVGGGDSAAAVRTSASTRRLRPHLDRRRRLLEYLEGKALPGLAALED